MADEGLLNYNVPLPKPPIYRKMGIGNTRLTIKKMSIVQRALFFSLELKWATLWLQHNVVKSNIHAEQCSSSSARTRGWTIIGLRRELKILTDQINMRKALMITHLKKIKEEKTLVIAQRFNKYLIKKVKDRKMSNNQ